MRPFLPKVHKALELYVELDEEGRYRYSLKEIGKMVGMSGPAVCRAAKKHGLSRYLTR